MRDWLESLRDRCRSGGLSKDAAAEIAEEIDALLDVSDEVEADPQGLSFDQAGLDALVASFKATRPPWGPR